MVTFLAETLAQEPQIIWVLVCLCTCTTGIDQELIVVELIDTGIYSQQFSANTLKQTAPVTHKVQHDVWLGCKY